MRLSFQSLSVCWFYCGHWFRSTSSLSCRAMVLMWLWVSLTLVFAFFFSFLFIGEFFVLFCGTEDGWWLCFGSVILSENLESGFLDWRYGLFSSGVVLLDAYLDSTWLVLSWCYSKGLGALMLRVDGSSRSSYLKYFIRYGCFLHRWWTVVDLFRLFIPWFGLRLKFQDRCDFVDSVRNWLFWLERVFMVFWYFENSCWNLGHLCVGKRSLDCMW